MAVEIKTLAITLVHGIVALASVVFATNAVVLFAKFISSQHEHSYGPQYKHTKRMSTASDAEHDANWMVDLAADSMLLICFVLQHSLMAHRYWKQLMHMLCLDVIERAIYVICTSATLIVVVRNWHQSTILIWSLDTERQPFLWLFFTIVHVIGWTLILGSTLLLDACELIGLKQVYYYKIGLDSPMLGKSDGLRRLYGHMRHPGACALTAMLLLHPHMTLSRLLLLLTLSLYTLARFKVDKEDYSYIRQQMIHKKDEIADMIASSRQQEQLTFTEVWHKSFSYEQ